MSPLDSKKQKKKHQEVKRNRPKQKNKQKKHFFCRRFWLTKNLPGSQGSSGPGMLRNAASWRSPTEGEWVKRDF